MLIYFDERDLLIGLVVLLFLLPIVWRRKRSLSYLLFFSIFWVYLLAVVQAVIFPFAINTSPGNIPFKPSINLIPFYFGDCSMLNLCVRGALENMILTIPFGFGVNFLVKVKPKHILGIALSVGLGAELSQFGLSLAFRSGFRSADINDVILNAAGVLIGYALFRAFAWVIIKITRHFEIKYQWIFADIYKVILQ